jgi:chaperone required for assembly of F1-ATPase
MTVPPLFSDDPRPAPQRIRSEPRVLPRKFYKTASVAAEGEDWQLLLDGRKAKTPGKRQLTVPDEAIGERLAAEWAVQDLHIDPATMPLTTLACTAIDAVAQQADAVAAEIVKYAGTDLLCYRADAPDGLIAAEAEAWDPVLDWAARDLGAIFAVSTGLVHVTQAPAVTTAIARAIGTRHPLSLAALHVLTTLTGSAALALAVDRRRLSIAQAWRAAHIDEDWQIAKWGEDGEAKKRRAKRHEEAAVAAFVLGVLSR